MLIEEDKSGKSRILGNEDITTFFDLSNRFNLAPIVQVQICCGH